MGAIAKGAMTDENERKAYDEAAKAQPPEPEIHARHILVATEDEAKAALARIKAGEDFAKVAKEISKDPAGEGGDLGWFTKDRMVPEFSAVAFTLEPGQVSDPVKTQFGWHIIKVEEKRMKTFPPFDQVKDQAARYVAQKAQSDAIQALHTDAKIERFDEPPAAHPAAAGRGPRPPTPRRPPRRPRQSPEPRKPSGRRLGGFLSSRPSPAPKARSMAAPAPLSPLAPKSYPDLPVVEGVRFASAAAGVRYAGRTDVTMAVFDAPAEAAGVFTKSKCPSAAVDWCRKLTRTGKARAIVVNSGNANAFNGVAGMKAVNAVAEAAGAALGAKPNSVFMCSTGVIGEPLNAKAIVDVMGQLARSAKPDGLMDAARAIMTTDTFPKVVTKTVKLGGVDVVINGMAKGAGMIAPDMATMLAFVFTDAPIAAAALQAMLSKGVQKSFNCITVDSDTSTSDTLLLFATGAAKKRGAPVIREASDRRLGAFKQALDAALLDLAQQVVRDGEGARKFVTVNVSGAATATAAKRVALSIANSPLVKTAIAGEDANWGRVVMAVGKAGERAERDKLDISFGDIRVATKGQRDPDYSEAAVSAYMKNQEIEIGVDLKLGKGAARVYTCDLTKEYVAINGDYRS